MNFEKQKQIEESAQVLPGDDCKSPSSKDDSPNGDEYDDRVAAGVAGYMPDDYRQEDESPPVLEGRFFDFRFKGQDIVLTVKKAVELLFSQYLRDFKRKFGFNSIFKDYVSFLSRLVTLVYQLNRAQDYTVVWAAVYNWATGLVLPFDLSSLYEACYSYFSMVRTESASGVIKDLRTILLSLVDNKLVAALKNLISVFIASHLFPKEMALRITSLIGKPSVKSLSLVELIETSLDSLSEIFGVWDAYSNGFPISDLLIARAPVEDAIRAIEDVLIYKDNLYSGLPVEHGMSRNDFAAVLEKNLDFLQRASQGISRRSPAWKRISDAIHAANVSLLGVKSAMDGAMRPAPVAVIIYGNPGVGKSKILPFVAEVFSAVKGRVYRDALMYHRTTSSEYWEGYQPYSQPYIVYSELGTVHKDIVKKSGDSVLNELTSLIDSKPMNLDMADVSLKGKVYALPELVLADTNNKNLNLPEVVENPAAFYRRFIYVEAHVKPKYMKDSSPAIDPAKCYDGTDPMDRWTFKVSVREPIDNRRFLETYSMSGSEDDDIYKLRSTLTDMFSRRVQLEEAALNIARGEEVEYKVEYKPSPLSEACSRLYATFVNKVHYESDLGRKFLESAWFYDVIAATLHIQHLFARLCFFALWKLTILALFPTHRLFCDQDYVWWTMLLIGGFWSNTSILLRGLLILVYILYTRRLQSLVFLFHPAFPIVMIFFGLPGMVTNAIVSFGKKRVRALVMERIQYSQRHIRWRWSEICDVLNARAPSTIMQRSGIALSLIICVMAIKKALECYKYVLQPESEFLKPSIFNERLRKKEEEVMAKEPFPRVENKQHKIWTRVNIQLPDRETKGSLQNTLVFLRKNVRVAFIPGDEVVRTRLLGVAGNFALVNKHAFKRVTLPCTIRVCDVGCTEIHEAHIMIEIGKHDMTSVNQDIVMVRLSKLQFKNYIPYFLKDPYRDSLPVRSWYDGDAVVANLVPRIWVSDENDWWDNVMVYKKVTDKGVGMCGSPLVAYIHGGIHILGVHSAGNIYEGYSITVLRKQVENAMRNLKDEVLHPIHSESMTLATVLPSTKSLVRYEDVSKLHYLGSTGERVSVNDKSKLLTTNYYHIFEKILGLSVKDEDGNYRYAPPLLRPATRGGNYIYPFNVAIRKMNRDRPELDMSMLKSVVVELAARICDSFPSRRLNPYPMDVAINGDPRDAFIHSMNAATGAGYGWDGKKSRFIPLVEGIDRHFREPTNDLKARLFEIMQKYEESLDAGAIIQGHLKDEPRPYRKVITGSTRVFYISPIESIILARMFLSPFYTMMLENGEVFGTAVGVNMHTEAGDIIRRITRFSTNILEGDYGSFDIGMPPAIGRAANSVIYNVLKTMGFNEAALKCVAGLLTDNLFPIISINGDLFKIPGMQPSGKYATAEDNSLRGVIMLMYAYYKGGGKPKSFFENVSPVTYGDDLLAGVSDNAKWFTNNYYQTFCKNYYNIDYTSADKKDAMRDFVPISEITFLKRRFVERDGLWIAPLAKESLLRSMTLYIPSAVISPLRRDLDSINSFLWEYYFHVRKDEFDNCRSTLCSELPPLLGISVDEHLVKWQVINESLFSEPSSMTKWSAKLVEPGSQDQVVMDTHHGDVSQCP